MANTYRMVNAEGAVRRRRSLTTFHEAGDVYFDIDGFHFLSDRSGRGPRGTWEHVGFASNAAERFALESYGAPVLVVDETDSDRFVGIYGAKRLTTYHDELYVTDYDRKVAEWWEWVAERALSEALIFQPHRGENKAWRWAKNAENHNKAIIRRYDLLYRAARYREGKVFPELTPALVAARDASRRAREALTTTTGAIA